MKQPNKTTSIRRRWSGVLIVGIVLAMIASLFIPLECMDLIFKTPLRTKLCRGDQRIEALRAERLSETNPDCLPELMTHGDIVQQVIILVHGYTNCPAQFDKLGQQFYDLGYNVLIAPLPHHGLANRLTDEQNQLTAEELAEYADEMADMAHGLGRQIRTGVTLISQ